jgi:hypothetical protein
LRGGHHRSQIDGETFQAVSLEGHPADADGHGIETIRPAGGQKQRTRHNAAPETMHPAKIRCPAEGAHLAVPGCGWHGSIEFF